MGAPYSQDLRDRVLAAYDRGKQTCQIAQSFDVSPAWARRVKQVRREKNRTTPLPMGGIRVTKIDMDRLAQLVQEQPDATIAELHQRLGGKATCGESAVAAALLRVNLTFKKRHSAPPSKIVRMWRSSAATGKTSRRQPNHSHRLDG